MAGRGRGRGGARTVTAEALGIERGEEPIPVLQPPPLFPILDKKPLPFDRDIGRLITIKQHLRTTLNESEFFLKPPIVKSITERYSESLTKRKRISLRDNLDMSRFPKELSVKKKKKAVITPQKPKTKTDVNINIYEKLMELEKKENEPSDNEEEDEEKAKDDEENEEKEEEYDEEIEEEETDYISSYFDNGEGFLDEEDDNLDDDGPVY